jgi:RP/EB family microtubule-associated protein
VRAPPAAATALPPAKVAAAPARAAAAAPEQENHAPVNRANASADNNKELVSLRQANQESTRAYAELRTEMEGLEKERDFYFEKLRDIEIVLQDLEDKGEGTALSASLFKILYATADGFEPLGNADAEEPTKSVDVYPESVPYDDNQESY